MLGLFTTLDLASWTSEPTRVMALAILALAAYGFRFSQRPSAPRP